MIALAAAESAVSSVAITQAPGRNINIRFQAHRRCHSSESLDFTGPWVHSFRLDPVSVVFSGSTVTRKR